MSVQQLDDTQLREHEESQASEDVVETQETARSIANTLLDLLPEQERQVLIARHVDELSVVQVSARLGITPDQVKKRCQAGLERARQIAKERGLLDVVV